MLLIQALKLVGKKPNSLDHEIKERVVNLTVVSSHPSDQTVLEYGTPEQQKAKVKELTQAALDKILYLGKLKHAISVLNTRTELTLDIGGKNITKTVDAWIHRKDVGIPLATSVLKALRVVPITPKRTMKVGPEKEVLVEPVPFFDITERDTQLELLLEERRQIDAALDKFNIETEIPADLLG